MSALIDGLHNAEPRTSPISLDAFMAACVGVLPPCTTQTAPFHDAPASEQAPRHRTADTGAVDDGKPYSPARGLPRRQRRRQRSRAGAAFRSDSTRQRRRTVLVHHQGRCEQRHAIVGGAAGGKALACDQLSALDEGSGGRTSADARSAIHDRAGHGAGTDAAVHRLSLRGAGQAAKITVADPQPYATSSAGNHARIARPRHIAEGAAGFKVVHRQRHFGARLPAPNVTLRQLTGSKIALFRGIGADGKAKVGRFASGLNKPFGIAFYPPGPDRNGSRRKLQRGRALRYANGDLEARGSPQHIADLPSAAVADAGHPVRPTARSCMCRSAPSNVTIPT